MIHIETKHYLDAAATKVCITEKTWKVFGITIKRKTFHYPEVEMLSIEVI